ncbi:superoxide dismutase [Candidatus Dependentiae bacterium]|nr:superoxide dismutase [Candidatus Dependentiae bacterium]
MYTLPKLPYAFDALEPYIDAKTMEIHYTKHHQKYIDELNAALKDHPHLQAQSLEDLLKNIETVPESVRTAIRNNGGGHYNHSLFWEFLNARGGEPRGRVKEAVLSSFKSIDAFKEEFSNAAKSRFGSGWAWLSFDTKGNLVIHSTANQDSPLSESMMPILGLDVWEHAYYLKYQNKRVDYIAAWWHVINWEIVEEKYRSLVG